MFFKLFYTQYIFQQNTLFYTQTLKSSDVKHEKYEVYYAVESTVLMHKLKNSFHCLARSLKLSE